MNPIQLFAEKYAKAQNCGLKEPTAVNVSTVSKAGRPSSRMVLLKQYDGSGFVFYTNMTSHKGRDITENPQLCMTFNWLPLKQYVMASGKVEFVSDAEADEYFNSRPYQSRIGAWASKQSSAMEHEGDLLANAAKYAMKWPDGHVPRPPHWRGLRLIPDYMEFGPAPRLVFRKNCADWVEALDK
jgi:pyridoxamine 5'-phosphate oxidase